MVKLSPGFCLERSLTSLTHLDASSNLSSSQQSEMSILTKKMKEINPRIHPIVFLTKTKLINKSEIKSNPKTIHSSNFKSKLSLHKSFYQSQNLQTNRRLTF